MFAPDLTLPALSHMKARFGDRLYGRYGFADAFHPTANWINPDVIGIDLGITLLSAENLRTGNVWRWFMANPEITTAMRRAGFTPADECPQRRRPIRTDRAVYELVAAPPEAELRAARAARAALPASLADRFEAKTFTAPDGVDPPLPAPAAGDAAAARHARAAGAGAARLRRDRHRQPRPAHAARAGVGPRRGARTRRRVRGRAADAQAQSVDVLGPGRRATHAHREGTALVPATLALLDSLVATLPIDRQRIWRRRLLDGRVDDLEPAARAAGLLLRRRADRRGAARRSGDDGARRDADLGDPRQPRRARTRSATIGAPSSRSPTRARRSASRRSITSPTRCRRLAHRRDARGFSAERSVDRAYCTRR